MLNHVVLAAKVARVAYRVLSAVVLVGFLATEAKLIRRKRLG